MSNDLWWYIKNWFKPKNKEEKEEPKKEVKITKPKASEMGINFQRKKSLKFASFIKKEMNLVLKLMLNLQYSVTVNYL